MSSTSVAPALAFRLGPGFWPSLPADTGMMRLAQATKYARDILEGAELLVPEPERLELIAKAAVEASLLLFVAATHEPSAADLDTLFVDFVTRCLVPRSSDETTSV